MEKTLEKTSDNQKETLKTFEALAPKYFLEGYSCSESIAKAAVEIGLAPESLVSIATSFSGGMSSRCLCGALAGSQIVLGLLHGKYEDNSARDLSKIFYEKFIELHKVACCKILTKNFKDFHSQERKNHCAQMVKDCAKVLDEMIKN